MPLFGIVKGNWLNKKENESTCSEIFDSHLVLIYISWEMTEVPYSDGNGIGKRLFLRREENQRAWKKPSEQGENQQPTQPTHATGPEPNADHTGGKRALSPLDDSCS